jgi:hypothetical protein
MFKGHASGFPADIPVDSPAGSSQFHAQLAAFAQFIGEAPGALFF